MKYLRKLGAILLAVMMLMTVASTLVHAEIQEMSDEFRSYLQDGKLVLNFAKPSSKEDWYAELICSFYEDNQFADEEPPHYLYLHDDNGKPAFSDDLSQITATLGINGKEERHTVDILWNYDEDVLEKAQAILQKLPAEDSAEAVFCLTDLEYVNYLAHTLSEYSWEVSMLDYSGDLKAIAENTNFIFKMDVRLGDGSAFHSEQGGILRISHGDTTYCLTTGQIGVRSNCVIYVPESTPDDRASILEAAQKRIDDYIGEGKITITDNGETVTQYYQNEIASYDTKISEAEQLLNELKARLDAEPELSTEIWLKEFELTSLKQEKEGTTDEYNRASQLAHVKNAVGDYVFNLSVNGSDSVYRFVVNKDDSKLSVPTYESVDAKTEVSASTDSSELPLDTVIKVEKITHGEEHERICGTLEIKDGDIYDIKLHSGSLDDYISQLKNGKFKVRLPIKDEYKGKELVVYYVDANGNKTEFNVTIKNGFAIFETDHFSIYTLTAKTSAPQTSDNGNLLPYALLTLLSGIGVAIAQNRKKR